MSSTAAVSETELLVSLPLAVGKIVTRYEPSVEREDSGVSVSGDSHIHLGYHPNPTSPDSSTIYTPLSTASHEIRLLNLRRRVGGELCGALEIVSLTDPGKYAALSYRWGDPKDVKILSISCDDMVYKQFDASSNLYSALEHLHRLGHHRIWVDAICINQADVEERSSQVSNMRLIYSKASKVVACVGEVSDQEGRDVARIFSNLSSDSFVASPGNLPLQNSRTVQAVRASHMNQGDIELLLAFFSQPYWKRIWILQEIAVAQEDAELLYGGAIVSWKYMIEVLENWETYGFLTIKAIPSHATQVVDLRRRWTVGEPITLFQAIKWTYKSLASIPRDKIFAVLGLTVDGARLLPLPNYMQELNCLLIEMTLEMIKMERSLDLICLGGTKGAADGPSWVPNWLDLWSSRKQRTLLVSSIMERRFPRWKRERPLVIVVGNGSLLVRVVHVGLIRRLSTVYGSSLDDLHKDEFATTFFTKAKVNKGIPSTDVALLARTLHMDFLHGDPSFQKFREPSMDQERAARCAFASLWTPEGRGMIRSMNMIRWLDHNAKIRLSNHPEYTLAEAARTPLPVDNIAGSLARFGYGPANTPTKRLEITNEITAVLASGLRLMVTDTSKFGMAPPDAREGDFVSFIEGCTHPVVLRSLDSLSNFTLVGPAYLTHEHVPRPLPEDSQWRGISIR